MNTDSDTHDAKAVVEQVVKAYAVAFHSGNSERLREIFLPDCKLQFLQDGQHKVFLASAWIDIVETRESLADQGHPEISSVTQIGFAGPECASATLEMIAPPTKFVDQLHLLRLNGKWRIVAKTFHSESA